MVGLFEVEGLPEGTRDGLPVGMDDGWVDGLLEGWVDGESDRSDSRILVCLYGVKKYGIRFFLIRYKYPNSNRYLLI